MVKEGIGWDSLVIPQYYHTKIIKNNHTYFQELFTNKSHILFQTLMKARISEIPFWENAVLGALDLSYIFLRLIMAQHHGTSIFHIMLRLALEHFLGFDFN